MSESKHTPERMTVEDPGTIRHTEALRHHWHRLADFDGSTVAYVPDRPTAELFASAPALKAENERMREALRDLLHASLAYREDATAAMLTVLREAEKKATETIESALRSAGGE